MLLRWNILLQLNGCCILALQGDPDLLRPSVAASRPKERRDIVAHRTPLRGKGKGHRALTNDPQSLQLMYFCCICSLAGLPSPCYISTHTFLFQLVREGEGRDIARACVEDSCSPCICSGGFTPAQITLPNCWQSDEAYSGSAWLEVGAPPGKALAQLQVGRDVKRLTQRFP